MSKSSPSTSSFSEWQRFLKKQFILPDKALPAKAIRRRLQRFPYLSTLEDEQDVQDSLTMLAQGRALLRSAVKEPLGYTVSGARKLSSVRRAREVQWRFVMAFSGFETMSRALILPRKHTWNNPRFGEYVRQTDASLQLDVKRPLEDLPSPKHGKARPSKIRDEFFTATNLSAGGKLARTLNLNKWDIQLLGDWIEGINHLQNWEERMKLAKALRNCSVHGALSASKTHELGFVPVLHELVDNLAAFSEAVFERLAAPKS